MTPARAAIAARHQHRAHQTHDGELDFSGAHECFGPQGQALYGITLRCDAALLLAENERLEAAVHACFALGSDGKAKYVTANGILQDIPRRIEPFARAVLAPQEEA